MAGLRNDEDEIVFTFPSGNTVISQRPGFVSNVKDNAVMKSPTEKKDQDVRTNDDDSQAVFHSREVTYNRLIACLSVCLSISFIVIVFLIVTFARNEIIKVTCPTRTIPSNGKKMDLTDSNNHDSTATFECNTGFGLTGNASSKCGGDGTSTNGTWSAPVPTCTTITCSLLTRPTNGKEITKSDSNKYNSTATFECNTGFGLTGNASSKCKGDGTSTTGKWSAPVPTCTTITCPPLTKPINGKEINLTNGNNYNSTATFECNTGFGLTGNANSKCEGDRTSTTGKWSASVPACTTSES